MIMFDSPLWDIFCGCVITKSFAVLETISDWITAKYLSVQQLFYIITL